MFEKMIESGEGRPSGKGRRSLLAVTSAGVLSLFAVAILASLFNSALAMEGEIVEMDRLVAPVKAAQRPEPRIEARKSPDRSNLRKAALPSRKQFIQRTEDAPARMPSNVSSIPSELKTRPLGSFVISDRDFDPPASGLGSQNKEPGGSFVGTDTGGGSNVVEEEKPKPVVPKPPEIKKIPEAPAYVGVVNGKAIFLDMPAYPDTARQIGLKGMVKVQVLIDENGNVASANAVEGHPILRGNAVQAARRSKFSPTLLNTRKIKVRGIIIYNFK